jgi:hypothetical protein
MGSANFPKACEKTGKSRQKGRADCRPVLPKSPRQATFVVRQSMIPIFGDDHAQPKISAVIRLTKLDQGQAGFRASDPLFSTD